MRRASVQSTDPDQEFQSLHTRDFAQRVMLGFIVLDQIAHDVAPPSWHALLLKNMRRP